MTGRNEGVNEAPPGPDRVGTEWLARLPGALFLVDANDAIVFANRACLALLGQPDPVGRRVTDVLMGEGDVLDWAALSQRARQESEQAATIVMLGHLPPPRPATLALQFVRNIDGFTGFLCTLEARGENEQLLAWLKTLEQTYSFLLEQTQDVYFTLAFVPRVAFTFVSPAIERLVGYRPVRFYGDPELRFTLFHPDDRPLLAALYDGQLATEEPVPLRLHAHDGRLLSVELRCQIARDEEGRPLSLEAVIRDVTHQMRTEVRLRASEERFRLLFERSVNGQYLFSLDGRVRDINAVALRMFGYLRSDVQGCYLFELPSVPAAEHERIRRILEILQREGQCEPFEMNLSRSDGTVIVSEISVLVVPVGEELLVFATLRDITARKEAEQRLTESRELLRVAMETSAVSLFLLDQRGVLKLFGGGGFAKLGWTAERVQGRSIFSMAAPYGDITQCVQAALDGETSRRLVRMPQQATVIELHCSPFQDRETRQVGVLGVAIDVTERVQAEEALAESKRQLEAIFATVQAGILLVDRDTHRIRDVNETALQMMRRSRDDVLGRLCFDLFRVSSGEAARCPLETEEIPVMQNTEVLLLLPDGSQRPILKSAALFTFKGRPHLLESFVDITERHEAQEKQRQLEAQIMNAQRMESLAKLAGGIAHDFNNLLTAVIGNLSLVMMDMPRESELYQCMSEIDTAAKRAAELSLQMLAYSGQGDLAIVPLDLASLLADLAPLALASVPEEATLDWRPSHESLQVDGDANWLRTAVLNLVTNAGEALTNKRGTVRVQAGRLEWTGSAAPGFVPEPLPSGWYAFIEVSDDGVGLSSADYARIFDPFFSTKFTGRGLGLAAVLGIMRGHQGGVWVRSAPGRGSVFRLLVPWHEASGAG